MRACVRALPAVSCEFVLFKAPGLTARMPSCKRVELHTGNSKFSEQAQAAA